MTNQEGGSGDPSHQQSSPRQRQQQQASFDPPAAVQDQDVVPESPSQRTLQLWREVAFGIDKNQTGKDRLFVFRSKRSHIPFDQFIEFDELSISGCYGPLFNICCRNLLIFSHRQRAPMFPVTLSYSLPT